jgi:magnesium transporter
MSSTLGYATQGAALTVMNSVADLRSAWERGDSLWIIAHNRSASLETFLREELQLHSLTLEDLWNQTEVAKVEDFANYVQVVAQEFVIAGHASGSGLNIKLVEFEAILGARFIVTRFHDQRACETWRRGGEPLAELLHKGPVWIMHALLDKIVDDTLPLVDKLDTEVVLLERAVLAKAGTPGGAKVLADLFALKRTLHRIRRVGIHQREVLYRLSRGDVREIPQEALPFFRDIHDHFLRTADHVDSYRELLVAVLDGYYSAQSSKLNEVMKTLTLISTIMMPLTFVAGIYGMNFENMPELKTRWGYPLALASMLAIAVSIYGWFRYKKWI